MSSKWGVSFRENPDGTVHVTEYKGGPTGGGRVSGDLDLRSQSHTNVHATRQDNNKHSNDPDEWRGGGGFFDGCFPVFLLIAGSGLLLAGMLIKMIS